MDVNEKEKEILEYWKREKCFENSLSLNENEKKFVFFDGPPFATGLPHYGHLVASTIKDVVGRYKTQCGYYVERRWGWDTHGLPIEFEIEKELGIKTKQEVIEYGIGKYNEKCREIVMKYSEEWKKTIDRIGRWVDMDNDYKTMDTDFMESVWHVFSKLYEKGLIYKGYKVMPYSFGCATPLSNFEAKDNYKETTDYSITVMFPVVNFVNVLQKFHVPLHENVKNMYLLVWTTTPWTLPANLAVCVNPAYNYVFFENENNGDFYIVQENCEDYVKKKGSIVNPKLKKWKAVKGSELVGIEYQPLFNFFLEYRERGAFRIIADDWVKVEAEQSKKNPGTGLVHCAPAFGEEDHKTCLRENIVTKMEMPPCPINDNARFTAPVFEEWQGHNIKDGVEDDIVKNLKERNLLFRTGKEKHRNMHCWRSDTPLIYRICESWFVNVEKLVEKMVKNNSQTRWVPEHLRDNRFGNWIENAMDWNISRYRFWGTPIPVWISDDGEEIYVPKSIADLERRANREQGSITDLHRHNIDGITVPSEQGKGELKRVPYVLDCWFESGSMPYAQCHWPFEDEHYEHTYGAAYDVKPDFQFADFIAEGLDQTRGWFYTLLVLSTALFDEPAYKNVIVNGIVLNEKGEKMSKRKKNYPPPDEILSEFGADALRLYLISTPVVKGVDIKFKKEDIREVVKKYHIMIENVNKFLEEMIDYYEVTENVQFTSYSLNELENHKQLSVLDNWMMQCLNELVTNIHHEMDHYRLTGVADKFFRFIDQLSRWYIKLNKIRAKDSKTAPVVLSVIANSLYYLSLISAPFTPFLSESTYQRLRKYLNVKLESRRVDSIHYQQIPDGRIWNSDSNLLDLFDYFSDLVDFSRKVRMTRSNNSVKMPFRELVIVHSDQNVLDNLTLIEEYLKQEMNILNVKHSQSETNFVEYKLNINVEMVKERVEGKTIGLIFKKIKSLTSEEVAELYKNRADLMISENPLVELKYSEMVFERVPLTLENLQTTVCASSNIIGVFDATIDDDLTQIFYAKMFIRNYQEARKEANLVQSDQVEIRWYCELPLSNFSYDAKDLRHTFMCSQRQLILDTVGIDMVKTCCPNFNGFEFEVKRGEETLKLIHTKLVQIDTNLNVILNIYKK